MNNKSVTLLEIIVVIIIIGILATLGLSQYTVFREKSFDRQAGSDLRIISAAERVALLESEVDPRQYVFPVPNTAAGINATLGLSLPVTNTPWNYTIVPGPVVNTSFCAQAERASGTVRFWRMHSPTPEDPDPQPETGECGP